MTAKPDMEFAWASAPTFIANPGDTKIQLGWIAEPALADWANWIMNRVDTYIQHINERGVADWDTDTSYVKGALVHASDDKNYKAKIANSGKDPAGGANPTQWEGLNLVIKQIYRNVIVIPVSVATADFTLPFTIDMDSTTLRNHGAMSSGSNAECAVHVHFLNSTTVRATRQGTGAFTSTVRFGLTEYE